MGDISQSSAGFSDGIAGLLAPAGFESGPEVWRSVHGRLLDNPSKRPALANRQQRHRYKSR